MPASDSSRYRCPTCGRETTQPSRITEAGTVYCYNATEHSDKKRRVMKKVK